MKYLKIDNVDLLKAISFTAPLTFVNAIPLVNLYLVDVFILLYIFLNRKFDRTSLILSIATIFFYISGAFYHLTNFVFSDYIQLIFVLVFISCLINSYNNTIVEKMLFCYCIGFILSALTSLFIYIGFLDNSNYFTAGRFDGVWGNPNAMGKSIAYFLLVFNILTIKEYFNYFTAIIINLICVFLVLTTASFSSLLMLFLSFLMTVFYYIVVNKKYYSLFLCIIFIISIVSFLPFLLTFEIIPETFNNRVLTATNLDDAGSGNSKILMIKEGFLYFLNNPILGLGLENSIIISKELGIDNSIHNFYILLLVEGGLFVFLFFIILILALFNKSIFKTKNLFFVLLIIFLIIDLNVKNNMFSRYKLFPWVLLLLNLRFFSEKSFSYKRS